jgi:hypothetical protein
MNSYFNNLRPFEKRMVVGIGLIFFVVANLVFIRPYFSDWASTKWRMQQATDKRQRWDQEISQTNTYMRKLGLLQQGGGNIPLEEQALHFSTAIQSQAAQFGVSILSNTKITTRTNQSFVEQSQGLSLQSQESQLVDFLYNLGSDASFIRVRDLSVRPDPQHYQLVANVKLVASYLKKTTVKSTSPNIRPAPARSASLAESPAPSSARPATSTAQRP